LTGFLWQRVPSLHGNRKYRAWCVGMGGHGVTVQPVHAFSLIEQRDIELARRVHGRGYWCVALWAIERAEPITLDHAEVLGFERLCFQSEAARYLRAHHPIPDMRAIYDRCVVHLDHELRRRSLAT
jgi:hypothetical protein